MSSSTEPKTIILRGTPDIREGVAAAAITPGHLIEMTSTGALRVEQTVTTERPATSFAVEAGYAGGDIGDVYAVGSTVTYVAAKAGDQVYAWLEDAQNVAIGAMLQSAGQGALKADGTGAVIARALEAVNNTGGTVAQTRIKVEII